MVQLSYSYMTTGNTIALTIWIFIGKVMSLLFKMLSNDEGGLDQVRLDVLVKQGGQAVAALGGLFH